MSTKKHYLFLVLLLFFSIFSSSVYAGTSVLRNPSSPSSCNLGTGVNVCGPPDWCNLVPNVWGGNDGCVIGSYSLDSHNYVCAGQSWVGTGLCPGDAKSDYNGKKCTLWYNAGLFPWGAYLKTYDPPGESAVWDSSEGKCFVCAPGGKEGNVYATSSSIYCPINGNCNPIAGDGRCESACGVDPRCDEVTPGTNNCDANCNYVPQVQCGGLNQPCCSSGTQCQGTLTCQSGTCQSPISTSMSLTVTPSSASISDTLTFTITFNIMPADSYPIKLQYRSSTQSTYSDFGTAQTVGGFPKSGNSITGTAVPNQVIPSIQAGNYVFRAVGGSGFTQNSNEFAVSLTGRTSSTNPCQTAGQCFPDAGCRRGATLGFCLSLSEYQSYSSLNNFFEPLSGTYSCGPNNCLVACHNDECCQIIRGNCYASVGTLARMGVVGATLANLPTGCGTFGPTTDTNLLLNCDDAGGNSCAGTQPPGATLVDQDPHYGPQHCYNLQNQCTAPQTNCNGQCVNTNTDNNNCGICGNECDIGLTCTNGQCQPSGGGGGTSTVTTTVTSTSTVTTTTTTTTTTTPPTTTTTTTTTTTQPPIFAISCGACEAGLTCSCSLSGTCNKGNWVLSNSQGTPLSQTLRSAIPPLTFTYVANDSGTILAEATCADPANYNFTTVTVTPKFLTCQDSCNTGVDCICQIRDCTSGVAYVSNSVGTPIPTLLSFQFNGNYALKFQATQGGEVEVRAICDNPVKSVKSTIKINGTTTTTTPPTTGIFTVSNFACSPLSGTTGAYKCSASYNNGLNENVVLIMLVSLKSSGAVKTYTPFTLPQIQDQISTNYYCSILGTGTYYVSWQAYRQSDSLQVNPIAWSTGAETQTIVCS